MAARKPYKGPERRNSLDRRKKRQTPIILNSMPHYQRHKPAYVKPGILLAISPNTRKDKRRK